MPGMWGIREWQPEDLFSRGSNRPRTDSPPPSLVEPRSREQGGLLCIKDVAQAEVSVLDDVAMTESWARDWPAGKLDVEEVASHVNL